jgi:hypothetical protein
MKKWFALMVVMVAMLAMTASSQASVQIDPTSTCATVSARTLSSKPGGAYQTNLPDDGSYTCQPGFFWIDVYTYDENGHYHNWHCQYLCDGYNVIQLQCFE